MTTVTFEIHAVRGSDVEELGEDELARRLDVGGDDANALIEMDPLEGAIVIESADARAAILDELDSAVQRLCFEAVVALIEHGAEPYIYQYFNTDLNAELVPSGRTFELRGQDIPSTHHQRDALLKSLYACGTRYLAWLERLQQAGREATVQLAHLRPFADRARAALRHHGLA